jgi:thiol-disulfide isomerase/thioredoxin
MNFKRSALVLLLCLNFPVPSWGTEVTEHINLKKFIEASKIEPGVNKSEKPFSGQTKQTLVVGFASWCSFCHGEMPEIIKIQNKYKACGLSVLGIGVEKKPDLTTKAVQDWGIKFPVILDDQYVLKRHLSIKKIPALFLTDADGLITRTESGVTGAKTMYAHIKDSFKNTPCAQK